MLETHCICASIEKVSTQTRLIIIRHHAEALKSTGTARVAMLALENAEMHEFTDHPEALRLQFQTFDGILLFPPSVREQNESAVEIFDPLRHGAPKKLAILDGTWRQTRRMLKKLNGLCNVPRLVLPSKTEVPLRLRESPTEEGRSTLEAIADALLVLEGEEVSFPLERLHTLFVERVLRARGVYAQKTHA